MPALLVTGMSGVGTSTLLRALGRRGQRGDVVLLSVDRSTMLQRLATRTTNVYGRSPDERRAVLADLETFEPMLRATATLELDGTSPVEELAAAVEARLRAAGLDLGEQ